MSKNYLDQNYLACAKDPPDERTRNTDVPEVRTEYILEFPQPFDLRK